MPTWFLPPDFTFKPEKLPLGAIISHPKYPTDVLALPASSNPPITLPEQDTLVEEAHVHSREVERAVGVNLLAKIAELFSGAVNVNLRRRNLLKYGEVDHEIRTFTTPFAPETLKAIVALPDVRDHIDGSLFGKRPVYIISELRVARTSFTVTKERGTPTSATVSGSGPVPAGLVPMEVGGGISDSVDATKTDEWKTAPGIVFAYQVYAIRAKEGGGSEARANILESSTAFMTGEGEEKQQVMEVVEATIDVLEGDFDELTKFDMECIGDNDVYISFK
ncbi:hypothetical protein MFIFM68171_02700 [Madurella fahalii]|uniref:Uncharacterized protein n=1 Tax=Madurella fahalii TaxID=1157608 RepID=A0ABQ0G420_9PEZI